MAFNENTRGFSVSSDGERFQGFVGWKKASNIKGVKFWLN
jgi:hypothetical protein